MIKTLLHNVYLFLTFRSPSAHLHEHVRVYLVFGLLATWLAGVGRYWDNPRAELWQYLGLGSVAYVFVLALLLYIFTDAVKAKKLALSECTFIHHVDCTTGHFVCHSSGAFYAAGTGRSDQCLVSGRGGTLACDSVCLVLKGDVWLAGFGEIRCAAVAFGHDSVCFVFIES